MVGVGARWAERGGGGEESERGGRAGKIQKSGSPVVLCGRRSMVSLLQDERAELC